MPSNLGTIGFVGDGDDLRRSVEAVIGDAVEIGRRGRWSTCRWEDPSGARIAFQARSNEVQNLLPSFAGRSPTPFASLTRLDDELHDVMLVDDDGEILTRLTIELEERAHLAHSIVQATGFLVGLVHSTTAYPDDDAFAASDHSLLGDPATAGEPPAHAVETGIQWPPRLGPESFISYGQFAGPDGPSANAMLTGTVRSVDQPRNSATGYPFQVVGVRSIGIDIDLTVQGDQALELAPGMVVKADAFMVGSLDPDTIVEAPKRSWWSRRR